METDIIGMLSSRVKDLEDEVKRLKDKYEPDIFFIDDGGSEIRVLTDTEKGLDCVATFSVYYFSDAKERAEKLCAEMNEREREKK